MTHSCHSQIWRIFDVDMNFFNIIINNYAYYEENVKRRIRNLTGCLPGGVVVLGASACAHASSPAAVVPATLPPGLFSTALHSFQMHVIAYGKQKDDNLR
jgi:hypothetical protein